VAGPRPERAAYDAPTGLLLITHRHNHVHGSLDQLEAMARFILRSVAHQRAILDQEWPKDFLKQIADV